MNGTSTSIARQCAEGSCSHVLLVHAVARRTAFVACCFCLINGLWAMNRMKIMFIKFSCLPLTFMRLNVAPKRCGGMLHWVVVQFHTQTYAGICVLNSVCACV